MSDKGFTPVFPGDLVAIARRIGSGLMPDNAAWVNRFTVPSESNPSKPHIVAQRRTDGTWGCDCWGWKRYRHCKHVEDILDRLRAIGYGPDLGAAEPVRAEEVPGLLKGILDAAAKR